MMTMMMMMMIFQDQKTLLERLYASRISRDAVMIIVIREHHPDATKSLGGGFLRQRRRIAVSWQIAIWLAMSHGQALWHRWLVGYVRRSLRWRVRRQLMRDVRNVRRVLHVGWRTMVGRKGIVRPLTHHVVTIRVAVRRLTHRRTCLVAGVVKVRRRDLRAALLRWPIATIRSRRRLHRPHPVTRYKRLGLGIEGMTVEAARDWVLTLWVTGIDIGWKRAISVGYPVWRHWRDSRLVRTRVEAGRLLPPSLWLRRTLHR